MMIKGHLNSINGAKARQTATLAMAFAGMAAVAVQAAPNISGSVQASSNRNWAHVDTNATNLFHSYDFQANTFTLNNAHLAFTGADSATGLGYAVETDFGSDAAANSALDASFGGPNWFDLQEAYITWGIGASRMIGLKAGKYATYQGIEVVEGGSNPTISRGLLFGLAEPVTHTGLEVNLTSGIFDAHVGVINGWDRVLDNNGLPSYLAKVGINLGDPLLLTLSAIVGPEVANNTDESRMSFDATALTKAVPMVDLWLQVNYGMEAAAGVGGEDASWLGFGVQPLVHLNDWFGLGLRYEYFMDDQFARIGNGTGSVGAGLAAGPAPVTDIALQNFTVAPTIWLTKSAMVRAEFRMDMASEDVFSDGDNEPTGTQLTSALDFVLGF